MANDKIFPSLKSASGAGFTFEDKVAAFMLCEMLAGRGSLGNRFGVTEKLERQAIDWEPFGDLRITVPNSARKLVKCCSSVKSNKQINSNGCAADLCGGLWATMGKTVFVRGEDVLALFCSTLAQDVHQHLHSLCNQAVESDPARLDQKVVHAESRKIYDSFRNPKDNGETGLPGHVLAHFVPREFDFEDNASRDEAEALRLCREILLPDTATNDNAAGLWDELLRIAQTLRTTGGEITREKLSAKLRFKFRLRDDPCDTTAWSGIRNFSDAWLNEIDTALLGGLSIPRSKELQELRANLIKGRALPVLGETGSGKSASVKMLGIELAQHGTEVVWIKAERFSELLKTVPNFAEVCRRTRKHAGLLIFDALEGCYEAGAHKVIAQTIIELTSAPETPWQIIIICQTPEWSRVAIPLTKYLATSSVLTRHFEFTELSKEDFALVCAAYPSVARLSSQPHLRRVLAVPKMLDILLVGQLAENRLLASEADLVDWWWEEQVRGANAIAAEERVARQLAARMADELCTELPPDAVTGSEAPASALVQNRVLRRTRDGRLRFDHDLLADWSRVMHLRSLGDKALDFMRAHAENPPWLRAIHLLSQYQLERVADLEHWRGILMSCSIRPKDNEDPSVENLQVLDAWLEGIAYCIDAKGILDILKPDLFRNDGWLLRRLVSRQLHVGTVPDPVIQDRFRQMDSTAVETAGILYRLPQPRLWTPLINFLIAHKTEVTDFLPVELTEVASMWSRLEEYFGTPWPHLADVILLNGEKEIRREVAGEYRFDRGPISLGGGHESRVRIYSAALRAATQFPDRTAKLLLKAAGRAPWDAGDVSENAREEWRGEWHEHSPFRRWDVYIKEPPESWPDGPNRFTSDEFFHAWFETGVAQILYKKRPDAACEATLALLISWPKTELFKGHEHHGYEVEHRGFTSEASHMYPPFWHKGNFLGFLRQNWRPALDMIIRLVNFATDRHQEVYRHAEVTIHTPKGEARWKGNQDVYKWHHFNMQSADAVVCALMALEKWFDEQLNEGKPITEAVELLYEKSNSFASAGLLISLGKRFPHLFANELKPLLFIQHFYICDIHSTRNYFGVSFWRQDDKIINKLQREWSQLPGRKIALKDICLEWLLTRSELADSFKEVSTAWRQDAEKFPEGSEDKIVLLRWAADFDRSLWRKVTLPDGRTGWSCERPAELQDEKAAERQSRIQQLMTLPYQCSDWLEQGQEFSEAQLDSVWNQLQNWTPYQQLGVLEGESQDSALFRDHQHGRAGLLAIILCAGHSWLKKHSERRKWLETEICKILNDPPHVISFSPDEVHDDYESLLARAVVQCWVHSPHAANWRGYVASFVTARRYRTVFRLFQEAFKVRQKLGNNYRELEAFALAFAVERKKATQFQYFRTRTQTNGADLQKWGDKWLRKFAKGKGPEWESDWSKVESLEPFPKGQRQQTPKSSRRDELYRRDYGLDMGVILAAFGQFPALDCAIDSKERDHWFGVCKQMVVAFCHTLPSADPATSDDAEWHYDHWRSDEDVFKIVARRLFECTSTERRELWQPIIGLPFAAHHHICSFLSQVVIEFLRVEPYRIAGLIPIWREMADCIFAKPISKNGNWRNRIDVQKHILLYGSFASSSDEFWGALVENLRPLFKQHLAEISHDTHDQSSFAYFLTTKAGERLLIDALVWLHPAWELARDHFWERVAEENHFANLLEHAWHNYFVEIRTNPLALKAFKILTLKLATHHVPIALEVQQQI